MRHAGSFRNPGAEILFRVNAPQQTVVTTLDQEPSVTWEVFLLLALQFSLLYDLHTAVDGRFIGGYQVVVPFGQ